MSQHGHHGGHTAIIPHDTMSSQEEEIKHFLGLSQRSPFDTSTYLYHTSPEVFNNWVTMMFAFLYWIPGFATLSTFLGELGRGLLFHWVLWMCEHAYFHGPGLWGWGFWHGMPPHDICALLVGNNLLDSRYFTHPDHIPLCEQMLRRKYELFLFNMLLLLHIVCMVFLILWCRRRCRGTASHPLHKSKEELQRLKLEQERAARHHARAQIRQQQILQLLHDTKKALLTAERNNSKSRLAPLTTQLSLELKNEFTQPEHAHHHTHHHNSHQSEGERCIPSNHEPHRESSD